MHFCFNSFMVFAMKAPLFIVPHIVPDLKKTQSIKLFRSEELKRHIFAKDIIILQLVEPTERLANPVGLRCGHISYILWVKKVYYLLSAV